MFENSIPEITSQPAAVTGSITEEKIVAAAFAFFVNNKAFRREIAHV